jgi:hypothetical protein
MDSNKVEEVYVTIDEDDEDAEPELRFRYTIQNPNDLKEIHKWSVSPSTSEDIDDLLEEKSPRKIQIHRKGSGFKTRYKFYPVN